MTSHRKLFIVSIVFAMLMAVSGGVANAQNMYSNDTISIGQTRYSSNGNYKIEWVCTFYCGLVHFSWTGSSWYAGALILSTVAPYPYNPYAVMQGDGNFVIYDQYSTVYGETNTDGNSGAWLNIQDDGNVVVYSSSDVPLWALY